MPSSHLILGRPLLLLPPIPPSIRVFSNESTLHMRWPKYWSFSFTSFLPKKSQGRSPSEWTGWISLHSKELSRVFSSTTIPWHSVFFVVQPSQNYMTTGKTITLAIRTHLVPITCSRLPRAFLFSLLSAALVWSPWPLAIPGPLLPLCGCLVVMQALARLLAELAPSSSEAFFSLILVRYYYLSSSELF